MNLTNRPIYQKQLPAKSDPARLAAVAALPCCICNEWRLEQRSPTTVHHCIMGRGGNRRAPDCMTIPLCDGHHQGRFDASKIAIHRQPKAWREAFGPDTDWISWTETRIELPGAGAQAR